MSTISFHNLTKRYGSILAVDDLSFDVGPGRVTGFLGPNGRERPPRCDLARAGHADRRDGDHRRRALPQPARPGAPGRAPRWTTTASTRAAAPSSTCGSWPPRPGFPGAGSRRSSGMVGLAMPGTPRRGLLPRHAPAAQPGRRAARGSGRAGLRRAAQRAGPGRIRWLRGLLRSGRRRTGPCWSPATCSAEAAQTVDEVVVLARGRLDGPDHAVRPGRRDLMVRVRTPDAPRLLKVLCSGGACRSGWPRLAPWRPGPPPRTRLPWPPRRPGVTILELSRHDGDLESLFRDLVHQNNRNQEIAA